MTVDELFYHGATLQFLNYLSVAGVVVGIDEIIRDDSAGALCYAIAVAVIDEAGCDRYRVSDEAVLT